MDSALKLLIVDDDQVFGSQLAGQLTERDWSVSVEVDSRHIDSNCLAQYHAILIDLNMPHRTGLQLIKAYRDLFPGLMVVVSADGSHNAKKETLESGADFFMTKPVFIDELHWTLLRALKRDAAALHNEDSWELSAKDLVLIGPGKIRLPLAKHEYAVVDQLTAAAPDPVSRHTLIGAMGRDPEEINSRAIDVLLSRVKSRARDAGLALPIQAVRNQGYVFNGTLHRSG
jgi:DNA-binding response OmpR family regulator